MELKKEDYDLITYELGNRIIYLKNIQKQELDNKNIKGIVEIQKQIDKINEVITKIVNN